MSLEERSYVQQPAPGAQGSASEACACQPGRPPESELDYYTRHAWCLNAFPTTAEVLTHLREELQLMSSLKEDWCRAEALKNVFLFCCAVSDTVDDHLLGPRYDFSKAEGVFGPSRLVTKPASSALQLWSELRDLATARLKRWREEWEAAVVAFLRAWAACGGQGEAVGADWQAELEALACKLGGAVLGLRPRIPAAFRSQDLTHFDGLALGRKFISASPDRGRPVLVVGLRTAGSYFAPLLRAFLESEGFSDVVSVTMRPKHGLSGRESTHIRQAARRGALALVVDEPVFSATTVAKGLDCLLKAGFEIENIWALFPVHPCRRNWKAGTAGSALERIRVLTLEPEEWHKHRLLEAGAVRGVLAEYFTDRSGASELPIVEEADREFAGAAESHSEPGFHRRLKRAYSVRLSGPGKRAQHLLVVAKSVGWGWLSYHAFLAGQRLAPQVPWMFGLREGILYTEGRPGAGAQAGEARAGMLDTLASYLALRTHALRLKEDPAPDLARHGRHRGMDELASVLSGAYGWKVAAVLKRPRIARQLAALGCEAPILTDAKMRPAEWLDGGGRRVKIDFEHHGMGKHQLNVTDPAYDLADAILQWELAEDEERELIRRYTAETADTAVVRRLFLHKLLAGTWNMARAIEFLSDPHLLTRHEEFNRRYLAARRFLVIHTMRFCASLCHRPRGLEWSSPLVVLDVDGVLDKQIFGFPSTTAAGIEAVSLFAAHGIPVALNTARSVSELKEYCKAYGFVGGVAEYGSFVWDALSDRERVLLGSESLAELEKLRAQLREVPGAFVDEACRFCVRAFTYARDTTVPLPTMLVQNLMAKLGLKRLKLHQTYTDSTVIACETDKGAGLRALLALVGRPDLETVAVGDSEPDLPMFSVASRSFAPAQISCPGPARLLGCQIVSRAYQPGLLQIARRIVHPEGGRCDRCQLPSPAQSGGDGLFLRLLREADRSRVRLLLSSILDPKSLRAFLQCSPAS